MLIRKDDTVSERRIRPSTRNANIGDPFGINFIGRDFKAVYPYHTLLNVSGTGGKRLASEISGLLNPAMRNNRRARGFVRGATFSPPLARQPRPTDETHNTF